MLHLLGLGALTHSIVVWSRHFTEALLRTPSRPEDRRHDGLRLGLLNSGVAAVLTGVVGGWWPVTVAGATAVAAAVACHGLSLLQLLRRSLPGRFSTTVHYYLTAACFLPVGATLGVVLARGHEGPRHEQMMVAHVAVNVLGWVGLTVIGTLLTLWPTMLRTRMVAGTERATARALPVLASGVFGTAGSALLGSRLLTAAGLCVYLAGLAVVGRPLVVPARRKPPAAYPAWSVLAGTLWLVGCLCAAAIGIGTAPTWTGAGERLSALTPFLAAGFGGQVLLGALSYLVPSVLGGGPARVRAANAVVENAGLLRLMLVNVGLLLALGPLPEMGFGLVLVGLVAFLGLQVLAVRASLQAHSPPVQQQT
jgi:nitrite reductase (NO-forming)